MHGGPPEYIRGYQAGWAAGYAAARAEAKIETVTKVSHAWSMPHPEPGDRALCGVVRVNPASTVRPQQATPGHLPSCAACLRELERDWAHNHYRA